MNDEQPEPTKSKKPKRPPAKSRFGLRTVVEQQPDGTDRTLQVYDPEPGNPSAYRERSYFLTIPNPRTGESIPFRVPGRNSREAFANYDAVLAAVRQRIVSAAMDARASAYQSYRSLPWWRRLFRKSPPKPPQENPSGESKETGQGGAEGEVRRITPDRRS